ncbi:C-C motif chemokine 4 [Leptosomus discolor]|uniref:C-C motif chemokine 4 n=1 Tax=Leptosomus discolor TaxID=188344 RepID=A0A091PRP8_LEPDC|nr:PREDICTED: C-C motif chemokine 18-like [Leptosomus discolor]KFQ10360.1 C-C motif chemokine 4 [Leptosomus discolor]
MKVFSLALLTLLLAALWTGSQGVSFRSFYNKCCYKEMFVHQKIPDSLIRSYQKTPPYCSRKAVRVELLKGRKFCIDPEEGWFQQYQRRKELTSTST